MCTDRDCSIFRGMIIACDACERNIKMTNQGPSFAENAPKPANS